MVFLSKLEVNILVLNCCEMICSVARAWCLLQPDSTSSSALSVEWLRLVWVIVKTSLLLRIGTLHSSGCVWFHRGCVQFLFDLSETCAYLIAPTGLKPASSGFFCFSLEQFYELMSIFQIPPFFKFQATTLESTHSSFRPSLASE